MPPSTSQWLRFVGSYYITETTCGFTMTAIVATDHTHYVELTISGNQLTTFGWNATCGAVVSTILSDLTYDASNLYVQDVTNYAHPTSAYCATPRDDTSSAAPETIAYVVTGSTLFLTSPALCDGVHHTVSTYLKR